jgi:methyl-accepting chemotaxis protein
MRPLKPPGRVMLAGFRRGGEEIRKLSDESKDTVVKIRALTDQIKKTVGETASTGD